MGGREELKNGLPSTLHCDGASHSLSHLAPFVHSLAGYGQDGADIRVRITFQSHVFSKDATQQPHHFLDEARRRRVFCPDRYAVSLGLPDVCREMLERNVLTWEERDKSGTSNLAILTPVGAPLVSGTFSVLFYYLIPSLVPGIDVEMIIKTCYEKDINFAYRRRREKIVKHIKTVYYTRATIPRN